MHALERFRMLLKCKWYEKMSGVKVSLFLMVLSLTSSQIKYRTQALRMETWGAGQSWWERCKLGWTSQLFGELDFCCLVDVAWWLPVFLKHCRLFKAFFADPQLEFFELRVAEKFLAVQIRELILWGTCPFHISEWNVTLSLNDWWFANVDMLVLVLPKHIRTQFQPFLLVGFGQDSKLRWASCEH